MEHVQLADQAAQKFAQFTAHRSASTQQRLHAAALRREAKAAALKADAFAMRLKAKEASERATAERESAKLVKKELESIIASAVKELRARMPADYASWGVIKTRAYLKLLNLVSAQTQRLSPNLQLTTAALVMMSKHPTWTADVFAKLAAIKGMPKELS